MDKVQMKIVTFNLLCDNEEGFAPRLAIAKRRFDAEKPDIIGFQEARPIQQRMLTEALPEYQIIGFGREKDFGGESNCVAVRKDTFTLFGFHQCWLSPTPFVPGTRFEEQSTCPRVVVTTLLKHKDRELPFRFYNTHLDHIGEQARVLGMGQIIARMKADNADWELPMLLTGDMNDTPASPAIRCALEADPYPLEDLSAAADYTFHGNGTVKAPYKIDYIFGSAGTEHSPAYIWDDCVDGKTISDHYPVACDVIL